MIIFYLVSFHTCWDRCLSDRHTLLFSVGGFPVKFCHFLWRKPFHQAWLHSFQGLLRSRMFDGFRQSCTAPFAWRNVLLLAVLSSQPSVTEALLVCLFSFIYHYSSWKRPFTGLGVQLSVAHLSSANMALDSVPSTARKQKQKPESHTTFTLNFNLVQAHFSAVPSCTSAFFVFLLCFPLTASGSSFTWHTKLPVHIHWAPVSFPASVDSLIYHVKPNQHNSCSGIKKI